MYTTLLDERQCEKLLLDHIPHVQYVARRIHTRLPPKFCSRIWFTPEYWA